VHELRHHVGLRVSGPRGQAGRFRYLDVPAGGSGPPAGTLVLVHAFPLNARMWEPQFPLAARGWRIVAPQLRAMDDGDGETPATSMDDFAGDVVDLLGALQIDRAVIGGLSLGGYVTFGILRRAPQLFAGLILADTRAEADTPEGVEGRRRMLTLVAEQGPAGVADAMLPKLLTEDTLTRRPETAGRVRALMLASSADAIAGAVAAMMTRPDSTGLLEAIPCPTLVVVGEHDQLTPPALSEKMHRAIRGSELARIPGAGHLANFEQPEAFNDALGAFLDRQRG
jgi:pimeloyl-ACP methyl ester carboxylesterase